MPLDKSKSKGAFKRNVRTLMHEVGKSPHVKSREQALAIAYATQRRGKAKGGYIGADGDIMLNPRHKFTFAMGGPVTPHKLTQQANRYGEMIPPENTDPFMVKTPQELTRGKELDNAEIDPYVGIGLEVGYHKADGGSLDDLPDVGPPLIDPGPQISAGSPWANKAADIGSTLAGHSAINTATLPFRYIKGMVDASKTMPGSEEAHEAYGDIGNLTGEMGMQMLGRGDTPGPKGAAGVFVGPYGAHMLREEGNVAPHPIYAADDVAAAQRLRPEFRDSFLKYRQEARDQAALATLESRAASNNPYDRDVWNMSGWSRGQEGAPRKEVPDIGASLNPVKTDKYGEATEWQIAHPAGDFHKIYDIPNIKYDPTIRMQGAIAAFNPHTNQILFGFRPSNEKEMSQATSYALHELQHAIQHKEGFAVGANPFDPKTARGAAAQSEFFPGHEPSWQQSAIEAERAMAKKYNPDFDPLSPQASRARAAEQAYSRSAGETEARNVQNRRAKSFRYKTHPEFTEDVPRGLQWADTQAFPRDLPPGLQDEILHGMADKMGFADGGTIKPPPWFVRSEARNPMGMIRSAVPGRTDKIPMNVPGGSYVLPADIPSALGQGNTMAGGTILDKMFNRGPYGMNLPRAKSAQPRMARMSSLTKVRKSGFAEGGDAKTTPIIAAGGEFVLDPEQVAQVGGGDMERGHEILDAFVKHVRSKHIQTLKKLPGPKRD